VIEPYAFIRTVTLVLGLTWTVTGTVRVLRFAASWEQKLAPLGLDERWWRRCIALSCLLVGLLTLP
jgi:hypothetical protein